MLEFPAGCCNERVAAAQRSRHCRRALLAELSVYVYRYPHSRFPNLDDDAAGDFYLFCRKKLQTMINAFEERGAPFEHYVNSVLHWQLRSFLKQRNEAERAWRNSLYSEAWDGVEAATFRQRLLDPALGSVPEAPAPALARLLPAPPPRASALRLADPPGATAATAVRTTRAPRGPRARRFRLPSDCVKRRMVFALLKTAHLLDDRQFDLLATASGCPPDSLMRLVGRLQRLTAEAHHRRARLRERRNQAFSDYHLWAAALYLEADRVPRERARRRAERRHFTLTRAHADLARLRAAPSNLAIATLLGVPKGTVDHALHWLRHNNAAGYLRRHGVRSGQQQSA